MLPTLANLSLGPVHCAWRVHRHGTPAEPVVRRWLAGPLQSSAQSLPLHRDARGRPRLGPPHAGIDVSWSHSGDGLLMARGEGVRLGTDLERVRPRPRALELAQRFFAKDEARQLAALSAPAREQAFLRLWCAKEAVLKAHGHGLSFGLERLVFAADGDDWALVDCDPALGTATDWSLHHFQPAPGYLAVVAWARRSENRPDAGTHAS
ncbi:4'-phosphopantetheinyl transferase superfamily protein [soil metagenome]